MSSYVDYQATVEPPPPPPPNIVAQYRDRGEAAIPLDLRDQFGDRAYVSLHETLDELNTQGAAEVLRALEGTEMTQTFDWKKRPDTEDEYQLVLRGDRLPAELRGLGDNPRLEVTLRVGEGVVRLSHEFRAERLNLDRHPRAQIERHARAVSVSHFNRLNVLSLSRSVQRSVQAKLTAQRNRVEPRVLMQASVSRQIVNSRKCQISVRAKVHNLVGGRL